MNNTQKNPESLKEIPNHTEIKLRPFYHTELKNTLENIFMFEICFFVFAFLNSALLIRPKIMLNITKKTITVTRALKKGIAFVPNP